MLAENRFFMTESYHRVNFLMQSELEASPLSPKLESFHIPILNSPRYQFPLLPSSPIILITHHSLLITPFGIPPAFATLPRLLNQTTLAISKYRQNALANSICLGVLHCTSNSAGFATSTVTHCARDVAT